MAARWPRAAGRSATGRTSPFKSNGTYLRVLARPLLLRAGLLKIVVCVRMASSSARKRRSTRTDFSFVQVLAALPRANRVLKRINTIRLKTRFLNKAESVLFFVLDFGVYVTAIPFKSGRSTLRRAGCIFGGASRFCALNGVASVDAGVRSTKELRQRSRPASIARRGPA